MCKNAYKTLRKMPEICLMIVILLTLIVDAGFSWPPFDEEITPILEGDVNGDGIVNIQDASLVSLWWQQTVPPAPANVDLNGDGIISIEDATIIALNWLKQGSCPYSLDFEFDVPAYSDDQVVYYNDFTMYIPIKLSGKAFYLQGYVDDWVQNIRIDGNWVYSGPSNFGNINIPLGTYSSGYHRLEFEFGEIIGAGSIYLYVSTVNPDEKALFTEFYTVVPNDGDNDIQYDITSHVVFPMSGWYYLVGNADDYISNINFNGDPIWPDYIWSCGTHETIYNWGDGFVIPFLYHENGSYTIQFKFGEIWGSGALNFQYIIRSLQEDQIGPPRYYSSVNMNPCYPPYPPAGVTGLIILPEPTDITGMKLYGGSKWKSDGDPDHSERYIETRVGVNASYSCTYGWVSIGAEIGLGNGLAEWALLPATMDDVGITMNLTSTYFDKYLETWRLFPYTTTPIGLPYECIKFIDRSIDTYSFPYLDIVDLEYSDEGESIIKPNLTAIGYTGTVIGTTIAFVTTEPWFVAIGALVGLSLQGVSAASHYDDGQAVCRCQKTITDPDHFQLVYNNAMEVPPWWWSPSGGHPSSASDVSFLKLNPNTGCHCGMTKVVLKGTIQYYWCQSYMWPSGIIGMVELAIPMASVELTLCIPWFLRG